VSPLATQNAFVSNDVAKLDMKWFSSSQSGQRQWHITYREPFGILCFGSQHNLWVIFPYYKLRMLENQALLMRTKFWLHITRRLLHLQLWLKFQLKEFSQPLNGQTLTRTQYNQWHPFRVGL
jgi:hypothetical protein